MHSAYKRDSAATAGCQGCWGRGKDLEKGQVILYARRLTSFPRQPLDTTVPRQFTADFPPDQRQSWACDSDTVLLIFSTCQLSNGCPPHSPQGPQKIKQGGRNVINCIPGSGLANKEGKREKDGKNPLTTRF